MRHAQDASPLATNRLTRRTALQGAGAAGLFAMAGAGALAPRLTLAQATPAATDLAAYPETSFLARELAFVELPAEMAGGWVRLTFTNESPYDHHAMFLKLNEGVTAEQVDPLFDQPDGFQFLTVGTAIGGPGSIGPGETSSVILELTPGEYRVICLVPGENDEPHYMHGMWEPLTVTAATSEAAQPAEARQYVALVDFAFDDLGPEQPAGEQVWQVSNVGQELHELVIYKQSPGVTYDAVKEIFGLAPPAASPTADDMGDHDMEAMGTPETGQMDMGTPAMADNLEMATPEMGGGEQALPPFVAVTGVAPLQPEQINWLVLDLEPGDYFAICFLPSLANGGAPHFMLGMIAPLTVQ